MMNAVEALNGIVERFLGIRYCSWFSFRICQNIDGETDFFEITPKKEQNKIEISGNSGLSIASGLKYYLKNYCHVYIGQQTVQVQMPAEIPYPKAPVYKKALSRIRYAYNYCTLSYTMPFWDEARWQRELDWLALSGVNLVLDFTGIEEVWYQFLSKLGYSEAEIQRWIVGPCYTAWQQMQNIEEFGGPVPRQFFADRAKLARKNQEWMRAMGMMCVRQGYGGMIPSWHAEHDQSAVIFPQGEWNGLTRPAMLDTASDTYLRYARLFYQTQEEVLGPGFHYYAADVFHEGGIRPESLEDHQISEIVLRTMIEQDPEAVWIVQAWRENPTEDLLAGIKKVGSQHALILDLSATDNPGWVRSEFSDTPWVYCMLDMYGGRVSTHGEADAIAREIPLARKKAKQMAGIGFASEATLHNPIVFDLLFDMTWEEEVDLSVWMEEWLLARYGRRNEKALTAWKLLLETAYKDPGYSHHGGYTQIFTFRPRCDMAYGPIFNELNCSVIKEPYYNKAEFEKAVLLLAECKEDFSDVESWAYDMQDLLRQAMNNQACDLALDAWKLYQEGQTSLADEKKQRFFTLFDACDRLMMIRRDTSLSDWVSYANRAGALYGKETQELFVRDAKTIITTWAGFSAYKSLADYAYRQYGGMLSAYYRPRWERFFRELREISESEWYQLAQEFIEREEDFELEPLPALPEIENCLALLGA